MKKLLYVFIAFSLLLGACADRATTVSESRASDDVVEVAPNQTAFVIPATGGNFSEQAKYESSEYLESKKVAQKRIILKKEYVGNKYVPVAFVVLVDRTPVAIQWTASSGTGTSDADQSLCAESNESIQVCFQLSLAAAIREQDAATFLYNFPTMKLKDGQINGVYNAIDLKTVVDNQIRQYLQRQIGDAASTRTLRQIIADKSKIITDAEKASIAYFKSYGITIAYVGLGGELVLDKEVQAVINKLFVAQQEVEIAKVNATAKAINAEADANVAILKAKGDAQALTELKKAAGGDVVQLAQFIEAYKWNGSRVTVMLAPESVMALPLPTVVPPATKTPATAAPAATNKP